MNSFSKRLAGVATTVVVVGVVIALYIGAYLTNAPSSASAIQGSGGAQLTLATVASSAVNDAHPTWVSYYAVSPDLKSWKHATTYLLPAHTLVHVTIYQFDSQTGLRNEFLGEATGVTGGKFLLNGKPTSAIDPTTASHVFAIQAFDVSVPLYGIPSTAKNPCANAPCSMSNDHETIQFSFMTPGPGLYRWQCYVPCAAGFIEGFGGPMQTVGYMDGYIKVV
jgi:hypothetical protein